MTQVESFDKKRDSSHDITADKANEINVFHGSYPTGTVPDECLDSAKEVALQLTHGSNALFDKWQIDCKRLTRRPRFFEEDPVQSTTDTLKLKCLIT